MDNRDTTRLFRLLQQFYPNDARFFRENAMLAWQLVLEPFEYEAIKSAALAFARTHKYPPDPNELCKGLLPKQETPTQKPHVKSSGELWQEYIEQQGLEPPETFSVSRDAREHGLTWQEAKEQAERLGLAQREVSA